MSSKKGLIILLIISIFLILPVFNTAETDSIGCCVDQTSCYRNYYKSSCQDRFDSSFIENNPTCTDISACMIVCCKYGVTNNLYLITDQLTCNQFSSDFVTLNPPYGDLDVIKQDGNKVLECQNLWSSNLPACAYKFCEYENEPCLCGLQSDGTKITTSDEKKFCGYDQERNPQIFTTKNECTSGSQITGYGTITINVKDADTNTPVTKASVYIDDIFIKSTNDQGSVVFTEIRKSIGQITTIADTYEPSTTQYDNRAGNLTLNILLYKSGSQSCLSGTQQFCGNDSITGCLKMQTCIDGSWSTCTKADPECPRTGSECGDNRRDLPNSFGLYESCDGSDASNCPTGLCNADCTCNSLSVCGNGIIESGEACEFLGGDSYDKLGCGGLYLGNPPCTSECQCNVVPATCGNGVVEGSEQCDYGTSASSSSSLCGKSFCIEKGQPGECQCQGFQRCGDGIVTGSEQCEKGGLYSMCTNRGECQDDCMCSQPACPQAPYSVSAQIETGNKNITLSWKTECVSYLTSFLLTRCAATNTSSNCTGEKTYIRIPFDSSKYDTPMTEKETRPISEEYVDKDVTPGKTYCYSVTSNYYYGSELGYANKTSSLGCVYVGDKQCISAPDEEFCLNNVRMRCNETNEYSIVDDADADCNSLTNPEIQYYCQGPFSQNSSRYFKKTRCIANFTCDGCNGLFSSFTIGTKTAIPVGASLITKECESGGVTIPDLFGVCYKDYTQTTINKYYSCGNVNTCYDYKSKKVCLENPCAAADGKGCMWNASKDFFDLGLGTCLPVNYELQDCKKCSNPDYQNNYLLGACNEKTCGLYGSKCYYNIGYSVPGEEINSCLGEGTMTCSFYDTKEKCVGSSEGVEVDTYWQAGEEEYLAAKKAGGTNQIRKRSDDYFGFGLCKWIKLSNGESRCVKDADNYIDDSSIDDCASATTECLTDFSPPTTTLIRDETKISDMQYLEYSVTDNVNQKSEITTYYCYVREGEYECSEAIGGCKPKTCYPNIETGSNKKIFFDTNQSGRYYLYYFSEDKSKNLEEVKVREYEIDAEDPNILFTYWLNSSELDPINYPDEWRSNLTFIIDITNENATCTAKLIDEDNGAKEVNSGLSLKGDYRSNYWKIVYTNLEDGHYFYDLSCKDMVGNEKLIQEPILIDADKSIHDPKPNGTLNYAENIELSVKTQREAKCRYSYNETIYSYMTNEFDSSLTQKTHTAVLAKGNEGINMINVKCNISDPESVDGYTVVGNSADKIIFAVDTTPPKTKAYEHGTGGLEFDQKRWYTKADLDFVCNDTTPAFVSTSGRHWEFGCKTLLFRVENPNMIDTKSTLYNQKFGMSGSYYLSGEYKVYTQSTDNGGNAEELGLNSSTTIPPRFIVRIDNMFPRAILTFYNELSQETSTLTYGIYVVVFKTSKSTNTPPIAYFKLSKGQTITISPWQQQNEYEWVGQLIISRSNAAFDNLEETVFVQINASDKHGLVFPQAYMNGTTIKIDTKPPESAILDPSFHTDKNAAWAYEVLYSDKMKYYNGTFYTNQKELYVTGKTKVIPQKIYFYVDDIGLPKKTYHQSPYVNNSAVASRKIISPSTVGSKDLSFEGDLTKDTYFTKGNYVYLVGKARTNYGAYKKYYTIKETIGEGNTPGSSLFSRTRIVLEEPIEQSVSSGQEVEIYKQQVPKDWFGEYITLTENKKNHFYVRSEDSAHNSVSTPDMWVYYDPQVPTLYNNTIYPKNSHTISKDKNPLFAMIREIGAGIDTASGLSLYINDEQKVINYTKYSCSIYELYGECYNISYLPQGGWPKGKYQARLIVHDYARNKLELQWNFTIDPNQPSTPEFSLINPPFSEAAPLKPQGQRWVDNKKPTLQFVFDEILPINITQLWIYEDADIIPLQDTGMNCLSTNNVFTCSFQNYGSEQSLKPDHDYKIALTAQKTLSDGTVSQNTEPSIFHFGIDTKRPEYSSDYDNVTHSKNNNTLKFSALVTNEDKHNPLKAYFEINGEKIYLENIDYYEDVEGKFKFVIPHSISERLGVETQVETYPFNLTIMDYAGNNRTVSGELLIDNEDPEIRVTNLSIGAYTKGIYCYRPGGCLRLDDTRPAGIDYDFKTAVPQNIIIKGSQTRTILGYDLTNMVILIKTDSNEFINDSIPPKPVVNCENLPTQENCIDTATGDFSLYINLYNRPLDEIINTILFNITDNAENNIQKKYDAVADLKSPKNADITIS